MRRLPAAGRRAARRSVSERCGGVPARGRRPGARGPRPADDGAAPEPAEVQRGAGPGRRHPRIAGVEHLEPAVDQEAVDPLGGQPAARRAPAASSTWTSQPAAASRVATDSPARPAPTTTTSARAGSGMAPTLASAARRRLVPAAADAPVPVDNAGGGAAVSSYRPRHARCRARPCPRPPVVPGYALEELLGRGGSGEVWRPVPRGGGPPVAVKVLVAGRPRAAGAGGGAARRARPPAPGPAARGGAPAAGAAAAPRVALVLDLLAGGSLAALLARRGRLRPGEVVTAMAPVAAALAHAHEQRRRARRPLARATSSSPPRAARCSPTSAWRGCSARRRRAR